MLLCVKAVQSAPLQSESSSMLSSRLRPPPSSVLSRCVCEDAATERALQRSGGGRVRGFQEIPHTGSSGWINLLRFWKDGRFSLLHKHMENSFRRLGPIYRYISESSSPSSSSSSSSVQSRSTNNSHILNFRFLSVESDKETCFDF